MLLFKEKKEFSKSALGYDGVSWSACGWGLGSIYVCVCDQVRTLHFSVRGIIAVGILYLILS